MCMLKKVCTSMFKAHTIKDTMYITVSLIVHHVTKRTKTAYTPWGDGNWLCFSIYIREFPLQRSERCTATSPPTLNSNYLMWPLESSIKRAVATCWLQTWDCWKCEIHCMEQFYFDCPIEQEMLMGGGGWGWSGNMWKHDVTRPLAEFHYGTETCWLPF